MGRSLLDLHAQELDFLDIRQFMRYNKFFLSQQLSVYSIRFNMASFIISL